MSKLLLAFFVALFHAINLGAQELPSVMENKPGCHMLSPAELAQKNQVKINYRTYHDYLYSRRIFRPNKSSIKDILLSDRFTYPEINRWVQITKWMNKNNPAEVGEIYLPPCHIIETGEIAPAPPQILPAPEAPAPKKVVKKKIDRWKYLSFTAGASLGSVSVESDDSLDSKFNLLFLKITLAANYQLAKDFFIYAGAGLNNYLSVSFSSQAGSDKSNQVNQYWDYFGGLRKKISHHTLSLQYDNMNFLLNQNQPNEFRLTPTRVDRIAIMDNYKLSKKIGIMGSFGLFHPLFSQATGYDFGLGPNLEVAEKFSLYLMTSYNQLTKDNIKNTSQAYVLGTLYRF